MSRNAQKLSASRTDCAAKDASEALSRIDQAMCDTLTQFKESVVQEIRNYKQFRRQCEELISQRTSTIQQLAATDPETALQLDAGLNLTLDIPAILFREEGVLCSFKPVPKYLASPEPPVATDEAYPARSHKAKPRHAARAASRPTNERPPPTPIEPPFRVLRTKKRPAATPLINKRLYTRQPPIKTALVTKEHYWVFDFTVTVRGRDHTALYTLRCPSNSCDNPVFSKHPLRSARAEQHFKRCGIRFRDTADLVRRYARLGMLSVIFSGPWS
ncbi:hypothetical protein PG996_006833 [Apiospora saccharicola]|uniref:Uncharacterized protein n=1 Tax=Apiospora saccharicola TaxID=335842 RepID=A0ABR1V945_9PEZI